MLDKFNTSRVAQAVLGLGVVASILAVAGIAGATTPTASAETTSLITGEVASAFPVVQAIALGIVGLVVFIWAVHWALGVFKARKTKI